ncbi:hypothetical protein N7451_012432 [Penicillium sp. IBT 35674x]|nr:hypothetical protein N7451_012432 [Penicillium sp. IBT 35674x]
MSYNKNESNYEAVPSSGGLVSALRGLKTANYLWLGWPGMEISENDRDKVNTTLAKDNAAAVYLDDKLAQDHYNGFSNAILWPILHYQSGVVMNTEAWDAYQRVNEIFADVICKEAADGDLIWVHDYHLFLLPSLLRERLQAQKKRCPIGFFLHTPFPVDDFWRGLPVQEDLLHGVLGSDIVGFHTDEYLKNFTGACEVLLRNTDVGDHKIPYKGRAVGLGKYVVGIDFQRFTDAIGDQAVQSRIQELGTLYKDKVVIIGVDRMDFTKGLPEKLEGFRVFLDERPEWSEKVVLIQIAIPSREEVKEYKSLEEEVSKLAGQIIGKHATPHSTPLLYIHRSVSFEELIALYSISDVCLLSSRRDGMNLVASEYIACQEDRHGVLVLSEFTGAATFLKHGSLLFNPSSANSLSSSLHRALVMTGDERKKLYEESRDFITNHTR